jgi:phosphopantetheine--protein transferase-like protein
MIGVDIESFDNLPDYYSGEEMRFFHDNYSKSEILYALSKKDSRKYFTCLFSLKEAVVKADNNYKSKRFNTIDICFNSCGQPTINGFVLSYSYSDKFCLATAIKSSESD